MWYVRDPEGPIELYATAEGAATAAHRILDACREAAPAEGWPETIEDLHWGRLLPVERAVITRHCPGSAEQEQWEVRLEDVSEMRKARIYDRWSHLFAKLGDDGDT